MQAAVARTPATRLEAGGPGFLAELRPARLQSYTSLLPRRLQVEMERFLDLARGVKLKAIPRSSTGSELHHGPRV